MTPQEIYNQAKPKEELTPEHLELLQVIENKYIRFPTAGRWMIGPLNFEGDAFKTWSIWNLELKDNKIHKAGWIVEDHPEYWMLRRNASLRPWIEVRKLPQGNKESELGRKLKELAAQL